MPATKSTPFTIVSTTSPAANATSGQFDGRDFDHMFLFITFTLGSLTSITLKPQFSYDGATFFDVYDANQTLISYTFSVSLTGCILLGSNNTNSRMQPLPFGVPAFQFVTTISGTATGSSFTVYGLPFVLGGVRE